MGFSVINIIPEKDRDLLREFVVEAYKRVGREYNLEVVGIVESTMASTYRRLIRIKEENGISDTREALKLLNY